MTLKKHVTNKVKSNINKITYPLPTFRQPPPTILQERVSNENKKKKETEHRHVKNVYFCPLRHNSKIV